MRILDDSQQAKLNTTALQQSRAAQEQTEWLLSALVKQGYNNPSMLAKIAGTSHSRDYYAPVPSAEIGDSYIKYLCKTAEPAPKPEPKINEDDYNDNKRMEKINWIFRLLAIELDTYPSYYSEKFRDLSREEILDYKVYLAFKGDLETLLKFNECEIIAQKKIRKERKFRQKISQKFSGGWEWFAENFKQILKIILITIFAGWFVGRR